MWRERGTKRGKNTIRYKRYWLTKQKRWVCIVHHYLLPNTRFKWTWWESMKTEKMRRRQIPMNEWREISSKAQCKDCGGLYKLSDKKCWLYNPSVCTVLVFMYLEFVDVMPFRYEVGWNFCFKNQNIYLKNRAVKAANSNLLSSRRVKF